MSDDKEMLREAARLMRERAEAATPGPWHLSGTELRAPTPWNGFLLGTWAHPLDAEHIASWHPAVALAVAELLEGKARSIEQSGIRAERVFLAVARTYLSTAPAVVVADPADTGR